MSSSDRGPKGVMLDGELEGELAGILCRLSELAELAGAGSIDGVPAPLVALLSFAVGTLEGYGVERDQILELAEDLLAGLDGICPDERPGPRRDH